MVGCEFRGGTMAQVGFPEPDVYPQLYEFTDCTYDGTAFFLADDLTEVVDIRVRDAVHGAIALHPAGRAASRDPSGTRPSPPSDPAGSRRASRRAASVAHRERCRGRPASRRRAAAAQMRSRAARARSGSAVTL